MIRDNLNPDFVTPVECDYYFEKEQSVRIAVYDLDDEKTGKKDFIGKIETTLGKIVGSNK